MPPGFAPAPPEILAVVGGLIATHFPHLAMARLAVLVRERPEDIGGGKMTVAATGVTADPDSPFEYIVWFAWDVWQMLDAGDREAIVFHELTHCDRDEAGKPLLKEHDAGVFTTEVERYGAWWQDAQARYKSAREAGESR
jgi:hypothetical protein